MIKAIVLPLLLLLTYAVALIAAGCGVGPIGLLLVEGNPHAWGAAQLLGWISIVVVIVIPLVLFRHPRGRTIGQLMAAGLLYVSWFIFVATAVGNDDWMAGIQTGKVIGNMPAFLLLSAPFQAAFIAVVGLLWWDLVKLKRERDRKSTGNAG